MRQLGFGGTIGDTFSARETVTWDIVTSGMGMTNFLRRTGGISSMVYGAWEEFAGFRA